VTLGQYKGIRVTPIDRKLTDEEIQTAIQQELEKHASSIPVAEAAANGDTVHIDFAGYADGEQFEGGTAQGYDLVLGSGSFIPGFEEQLVGASAGDEVDVNVTFPEQYHSEALAGKPALFKVTVHQVSRKQIPELTDEFVKNTYQMASSDEFMETVKRSLQAQKEQAIRSHHENQALEAVVTGAQVTLSEEMLTGAEQQVFNAFAQQLSQQGLSMEIYLQYTGMTQADLEAQLRPQAENRAKATAVLNQIAADEGIVISDADLDNEIKAMADAYDMDASQVKEAMGEAGCLALREGMAASKALDLIMSNVVEEL
jgi:trigger factor